MNANSDRIQIQAHREPWVYDTISLRIAQMRTRDGSTIVSIAVPLEFKEVTREALHTIQPESLRISPEDAQQFMDELWRVGIRPTEGAGSVGQLSAVNRHLEDMRRLVFKTNP